MVTDTSVSVSGSVSRAYGIYSVAVPDWQIIDTDVNIDISDEGFCSSAVAYGMDIDARNIGYTVTVQGCDVSVAARDNDVCKGYAYGASARAEAYGIVIQAYNP